MWCRRVPLSVYHCNALHTAHDLRTVAAARNAGPRSNGYGDGRAISIGELVNEGGARYELQLKGSGQTPFCRGADGRAVVRSSVRTPL